MVYWLSKSEMVEGEIVLKIEADLKFCYEQARHVLKELGKKYQDDNPWSQFLSSNEYGRNALQQIRCIRPSINITVKNHKTIPKN